jgi:hypothetical protein
MIAISRPPLPELAARAQCTKEKLAIVLPIFDLGVPIPSGWWSILERIISGKFGDA